MTKTRNSKCETRSSAAASVVARVFRRGALADSPTTSPASKEAGYKLADNALPRGFHFSATACGLRKTGGLDLALLVSDAPASAAAVFTTNRVQAAPVQLSRAHLQKSRGRMRAIVVNAGNANCSTGPGGMQAARATAEAIASELRCRAEEVLVCSTGVIGVPLRVEKILSAVPALAQERDPSRQAFAKVTHAIMTTDVRPKWAAAQCRVGGKRVRILGCAKGAGMIAPNMATMLAFILTDAAIAPKLLQRALRAVVACTFNRITVDGDTSTNDTVAVLANGAAGTGVRGQGTGARDYRRFATALKTVCKELALAIVADGEGAQRVVEVEVRGARSERDAEQVARTIANSPLVKTALAGGDPNWGRILAAAGRSGVAFDPDRASVWMGGIKVFGTGGRSFSSDKTRKKKNGASGPEISRALPFNERAAHNKLLAPYIPIVVDLGMPSVARLFRGRAVTQSLENSPRLKTRATGHSARIWTCDFTAAYVDINASYRT